LTAINGSTGSAIAWHDAAYFSGSYDVPLMAAGAGVAPVTSAASAMWLRTMS